MVSGDFARRRLILADLEDSAQARKCRALSITAVEPEVIEQLRVWAVELAEEADQIEWRAGEGEIQPLLNRR